MSLLLLLKPHGTPVAPPVPPVVVRTPAGRKRVIPPPRIFSFEAGTARIVFRANKPSLILIPELARARIELEIRAAQHEVHLTSAAKKLPLTYRAARDEREDDEFRRLVELVYLLSR